MLFSCKLWTDDIFESAHIISFFLLPSLVFVIFKKCYLWVVVIFVMFEVGRITIFIIFYPRQYKSFIPHPTDDVGRDTLSGWKLEIFTINMPRYKRTSEKLDEGYD